MRISYEDMYNELKRILVKKGFDEERASLAARIFADNSLDGVYSHGYIRFPRVIEYIEKGYIKVDANATKVEGMGALERWDGHQGMGVLNAITCMNRAVELAKIHGIGLVALGNTNHWMRGGTYGWLAANEGCIGLCWTNTTPNMPAWGGVDCKIGNNPFILSIPRENGEHVVVDIAMSQYSYGKLETTRLEGGQLPYPGGFDKDGNITCDPADIEETQRVLPIGYWKGSGMSIALDLIANLLAMGNTVTQVGKNETEYGVTQVMIAIDPSFVNKDKEGMEALINLVLEDIKSSKPMKVGGEVYYPGESTLNRRNENNSKGIPVNPDIWNSIRNM